ncbi:MAG: hypothetical protein L0G70_11405, partial [Rubrobacter sp.]|nr:hypothetical protein [Rubrobacter sp.]
QGQPSVLYGVDVESGSLSEIGTVGQGEYVSDLAIPTTKMDALPDTSGLPLSALITAAAGAAILIPASLMIGLSARRNS